MNNIFWIDEYGNKIEADGTIQTNTSQTHTTIIYNRILKKYGFKPITQKIYNEHDLVVPSAIQGKDRDVLLNEIDARQYAIEEWDWIRVNGRLKCIQIRYLTPSVKERLAKYVPDDVYDIETKSKFYPQQQLSEL